jgi:putative transposase
MYEYRKLTPEERQELVQQRLANGNPPHQPPHPVRDQTFYLLTAACFEHQAWINTPQRRQCLLDFLFEEFISQGMEIMGWVVLTNHYHLLVHVTSFGAIGRIFKRVHGRTAHDWNVEDGVRGRRVWYHYSDRAIRSERHYYATLNYFHYNPVKHGLVESAYDWPWSSLKWYYDCEGREWLRDLWKQYPIQDYGKDWDR